MKMLRNLISSGNVNVDLNLGQSFNLNVDGGDWITILNPPAEATAFTIKVVQGSTAFSVGIDTFTKCDWCWCNSFLLRW